MQGLSVKETVRVQHARKNSKTDIVPDSRISSKHSGENRRQLQQWKPEPGDEDVEDDFLMDGGTKGLGRRYLLILKKV